MGTVAFKLLALWAACCSAASSQLLQLELDRTTGQFQLQLAGRTWLQSGQIRFFVNGEWHGVHTAPGPPPPGPPAQCTAGRTADVARLSSVIRILNGTTDPSSPARCCQACGQQPGCNAWVLATKQDAHFAPGSCFLIAGADGYKPSSDRRAQIVQPAAPAVPAVTGELKLVRATGPAPGADKFGQYQRQSLDWLAISSTGLRASFSTGVRAYEDGATIVFEQRIDAGAKRTNHKNVSFADGVHGQRATTEPWPFLHWPSFRTGEQQSIFTRGGFVTWQGTMVSQTAPKPGAPASSDLGLSSGPVVLFDGLTEGGANHALVVSPASHFKGATMNRWAEDWAVGLSGEITEVPAGFAHDTILVAGAGVTGTMDKFGQKMRSAYRTRKKDDVVVDKVGYWTDNGAYYYGDAYPQHHDVIGDTNPDYNLTCCTKAKLLAAKAALDADRVPIKYMQLDDWWYHGPHPVRNFSGVKCVSKWELPSDTYPGGLLGLRSEYKAPFLLYGPFFCTDNQWSQQLVPAGADAGVPPPDQSEKFYTKLFEYVHAHGGIGYEVDFMSNLYIDIPEFRRTLDASSEWQAGMNAAGLATNTTIQFCMMQPSDLLNSLRFDAVTNGRASGDYAGTNNWDVGGASLLFWAMGMRPSKDNFWSGDGQRRQPGFHQDNPGTNGELNAILATMSTGPVGPSDGAGQHNTTRLLRTCAADGTILQPEKPLTPIDASYRQVISPAERQLHAAAVWSTHSGPAAGSAAQYHVIGVDVDTQPAAASVYPSDLYPIPPSNAAFAVRDWHRSAACVHGQDALATGCIRVARGQEPLISFDQVLTPGAFNLLGELGKFVPLSSKRFSLVESSAAGLKAVLSGKPGEVVHATALKPAGGSWTVLTADITIAASGTAELSF